ncbi:MAG: GNAT family N-acetyltransferase [Ruminococcaceae bacterium]|nr:GNAT family N-acetyltransferase [Oscillospiraceae bacterium]
MKKGYKLYLETERLILRNFRRNDSTDLYEYLSDRENVKFEPYDILSLRDCKNEARLREKNFSYIACELKESGKMIGNLYFNQTMPYEYLTWELGYIFNPKYHKRGFATEASAKVLEYGFDVLGVRRVIANCDVKNLPSAGVMERLQMRLEKCSKEELFFKRDCTGKPIYKDTLQYAILKKEFDEKREAGLYKPENLFK